MPRVRPAWGTPRPAPSTESEAPTGEPEDEAPTAVIDRGRPKPPRRPKPRRTARKQTQVHRRPHEGHAGGRRRGAQPDPDPVPGRREGPRREDPRPFRHRGHRPPPPGRRRRRRGPRVVEGRDRPDPRRDRDQDHGPQGPPRGEIEQHAGDDRARDRARPGPCRRFEEEMAAFFDAPPRRGRPDPLRDDGREPARAAAVRGDVDRHRLESPRRARPPRPPRSWTIEPRSPATVESGEAVAETDAQVEAAVETVEARRRDGRREPTTKALIGEGDGGSSDDDAELDREAAFAAIQAAAEAAASAEVAPRDAAARAEAVADIAIEIVGTHDEANDARVSGPRPDARLRRRPRPRLPRPPTRRARRGNRRDR